jgi:dipeptidyl aminopeptidase/acylaminoacyl peptidase
VSLETSWFRAFTLLAGLFSVAGPSSGQGSTPTASRRPVTTVDAIQMTRVAGPLRASAYWGVGPTSGFAVFSPDGKRFAIVTSRGNIEKNTNDYTFLLFDTADVFLNAVPRTLATFSSSSNRAGISGINWLKDNNTILFLGDRPGETTQLYSIRCSSGELKKLTNHSTSLVSYGVSDTGILVYAAESPAIHVINETVLRHGFHVTKEGLSDLIGGHISNDEHELFVKENRPGNDYRLRTKDLFDSGVDDLFLSPDGHSLVVKTDVMEVPQDWSKYEDFNIQTVFRVKPHKGFGTGILHYELIDTRTGTSQVLLDSPTTYSSSDVLWSPDSKSLLLCGTYLSLSVADPDELQSRRSSKFVVEFHLDSHAAVKIADEKLNPIRWDPDTNIVQFHILQEDPSQIGRAPEVVYYQKTGAVWHRLALDSGVANEVLPDVVVEQDLNVPARIVAVDQKRNKRRMLVDLNPQFVGLAFGKVQETHWTDSTGNVVNGGLYFPPDYTPGKRYPLVIQTHGFHPHEFWIDGPHTTVFAAQPLASKGIVVLQIDDIFYDSLETPHEVERVMSAYEKAVEYLDEEGIIDRSRVGLVGFSRTCLYVKYTLTHSSQHFAAAIVSDGVDAGYLQYFTFYNSSPQLASDADNVIGGSPFGAGLSLWLKRSPGFLMDKVQTPLLIQALGPASLLFEWQWYSGLERLGKPVDFIYLPTGTHILVKPWDRMVSQEGNVDWFCFWLKNEEDPDPAKAEQYARWRELRTRLATNPQ